MARIPTYVSREQLDTGRGTMVQVPQGSPIGEAFERLGASITALEDRTRAGRENAELAKTVANATIDWTVKQDEIIKSAPEDGKGTFFRTRSEYEQFTKDVVAGASPAIRQKLEARMAGLGVNFAIGAHQFEAEALATKEDKDLAEVLNTQLNAIASNPDAYDTIIGEMEQTIEGSSKTEAQKRALMDATKLNAQVARMNKMILDGRHDEVLKEIGGGGSGSLLRSLIKQESGGRADAISPKGAVGVMQIMPDTGRQIARQLGNAKVAAMSDAEITTFLKDPNVNVRYGTFYLDQQLRKYGHNPVLALAAYNAGPGAVDKWIEKFGDPRKGEISTAEFVEKIPFTETKGYVKAIMADSGTGMGGEGFTTASVAAIPVNIRQKLETQAMGAAEQQIKTDVAAFEAADTLADAQIKSQTEDRLKNFYAGLEDRSSTREDAEALRAFVPASTYRSMLRGLDPDSEETPDSREAVAHIQRLIDTDPESAMTAAYMAHAQGQIKNSTLTSSLSAARARASKIGPDSPFESGRALIKGRLDQGPLVKDPSGPSRQAEAALMFDEWFRRHPNATMAEAEEKAREIIERSLLVDLNTTRQGLPLPFGTSDRIRRINKPDEMLQAIDEAHTKLFEEAAKADSVFGDDSTGLAREIRILRDWRRVHNRMQEREAERPKAQ